MSNRNTYIWAGLGLLVAGSLLSLAAYWLLQVVWLTATGVSMLILAFIMLALGRTIPRLPPEVCGLLLQTGIENIATMVEELGIRGKAIYLPSSLAGGRPRALIPLHSNSSLPVINQALTPRLIVRYGSSPDDVGLLLSTPGSAAWDMIDSKPGTSAAALEQALTTLLSGTLGVADGADVVADGTKVTVKVRNPRIQERANWSHQCLGGTLASIVVPIVAEALDKPMTIRQEEHDKHSLTIELEVVS